MKDLNQVRWSPRLEAELEKILVEAQFDFKKAAKVFQQAVNRDEGTNNLMFRIRSKELQMRWTDIEMRRHGVPMPTVDDEPPALETPGRETSSKLIGYNSDSESGGEYNELEELD